MSNHQNPVVKFVALTAESAAKKLNELVSTDAFQNMPSTPEFNADTPVAKFTRALHNLLSDSTDNGER